MTPIYFPFTYISKSSLDAIGACFRPLAVYQSWGRVPESMRTAARGGLLDIRVPVHTDIEKLEAMLKEFRFWASCRRGAELNFLKAWGDAVPFFNESSALKIRSEIKKNARTKASDEKPDRPIPDRVFYARLFLQTAQEFDMQNDEIGRSLLALETMEQDLFKNLKGGFSAGGHRPAASRAESANEPGDYMTAERIGAWACLFQQDSSPGDSGLFITSSRSALEQVLDRAPDAEKILQADRIPAGAGESEDPEPWRKELMVCLEAAAEQSWPGKSGRILSSPPAREDSRTVSLVLYRVSGQSPRKFFAQWVKPVAAGGEKEKPQSRPQNTLLGLIEPAMQDR